METKLLGKKSEIELYITNSDNEVSCDESFELSYEENMQKAMTLTEKNYDSLDSFVGEGRLSVVRRDGCKDSCSSFFLEDVDTVDTNMDTASVPDSEYASEYFDLYISSEPLNKLYSPESDSSKDQGKATGDNTEYTEGNVIKIPPNQLNIPFFEEDFRYVTSSFIRRMGSAQHSSTKKSSHPSNADSMNGTASIVEQLPKVEWKQDLDSKFSSSNDTKRGAVSEGLTKSQQRPMLGGDMVYGVDYSSLENDFYLPQTLTHKCSNMVLNPPIASNYCVYVGADYNTLVCNCNLVRPCGGNSHASRCNVVAGEIELSTESWPVSKASYLHSLVGSLERCLCYHRVSSADYRNSTSNGHEEVKNGSSNFQHYPSKSQIWQSCNNGPPLRSVNSSNLSDLYVKRVKDLAKGGNTLISEIAGITIKEENTRDAFSGAKTTVGFVEKCQETLDSRNDVELMAKKRKIMKGRSLQSMVSPLAGGSEVSEILQPVNNSCNRFFVGGGLSNSANTENPSETQHKQHFTPKVDKKVRINHNHHSGEKVSGVWYDTNRHLWRVVYMKGNKRKTQGFSSIKLGYEEARRRAIQMRHEMVTLRRTDKI